MPRIQTRRAPGPQAGLAYEDFTELVRQPYAQPAIAALLERWFGYFVAGSHRSTEVTATTGERIDLKALYAAIQSNASYRAGLHEAAARLRK
jgi:hypothetical protein